ncbi:hypothetical protein [Spirosoma pollinicola]|nr:hypothetical protein [Spirosoma pollinicola]
MKRSLLLSFADLRQDLSSNHKSSVSRQPSAHFFGRDSYQLTS